MRSGGAMRGVPAVSSAAPRVSGGTREAGAPSEGGELCLSASPLPCCWTGEDEDICFSLRNQIGVKEEISFFFYFIFCFVRSIYGRYMGGVWSPLLYVNIVCVFAVRELTRRLYV